MRVYYANFIIKEDETWISKMEPFEIQRSVVSFSLHTTLFLAPDPDSAYAKALGMIDGYVDANNDGLGDRTDFSCVGIHELEDVVDLADLEDELTSSYGLDVGVLKWTAQDAPISKCRDELAAFRGRRPKDI